MMRFKGTLLGALVGDCVGAIYEGHGQVGVKPVTTALTTLRQKTPSARKCSLNFTDDSAMTMSVAGNFISNPPKTHCKVEDLCQRFLDEFEENPNRGYGAAVWSMFDNWKRKRDQWVAGPVSDEPWVLYTAAASQFNGSGSYGNGVAMRSSPVGLFCVSSSVEHLAVIGTEQALLTHFHPLGIVGGLLQALAVRSVFRLVSSSAGPVVVEQFYDELFAELKEALSKSVTAICAASFPIKLKKEDEFREAERTFSSLLDKCQQLLQSTEQVDMESVVLALGNGVQAHRSVATALFCFLVSLSPNYGRFCSYNVEEFSPFERVLIYSIALGGDTDTIASMACALAGCYLGGGAIPEYLIESCEGSDLMSRLAGDLSRLAAF